MVLAGCKPKGRFTEQHDIFFGIAGSLKELVPNLYDFWPEAKRNLHIDAWRQVTTIAGYTIEVIPKQDELEDATKNKIFFLNLGGYKKDEFDEFHYKLLTVAENSGAAIKNAKQEAFYKHYGFKGATSHVDDKYGVDIDDAYALEDILSAEFKEKYSIIITEQEKEADEVHLGYFQLWKIKDYEAQN